MRNYIFNIFILTTVIVPGLRAQYLPVIAPDHNWSVVEIHCQPEGNSYSSMKFVAGNDTTISETSYKTIWKKENDGTIYYGAFREDETTGRCWYRFPFSESDGLIYNFSLMPDDTAILINQFLGSDTIKLIVTGRDSVFIEQQWRLRLTLTNFSLSWQEWWIEGIGSQWGLLNAGSSFYTGVCGGQELLCFWEDGVHLYQNPAYPVCEFPATAINENHHIEDLKVFPNPANQSFNVDYNTPDAELTLMDLQGKVIVRVISSGGSYCMNVSGQTEGIYILKITTNQYTAARRLVIGGR